MYKISRGLTPPARTTHKGGRRKIDYKTDVRQGVGNKAANTLQESGGLKYARTKVDARLQSVPTSTPHSESFKHMYFLAKPA